MIHLKRFNESNDSEFYIEVSRNTYVSNSYSRSNLNNEDDRFIRLSQLEVDRISKLSQSHGRGRWICEFNFSSTTRADVNKTIDDWFWIRIVKNGSAMGYYKCDQIEGVFKLIRDKIFDKTTQTSLF